jgi:hypothetical protein
MCVISQTGGFATAYNLHYLMWYRVTAVIEQLMYMKEMLKLGMITHPHLVPSSRMTYTNLASAWQ